MRSTSKTVSCGVAAAAAAAGCSVLCFGAFFFFFADSFLSFNPTEDAGLDVAEGRMSVSFAFTASFSIFPEEICTDIARTSPILPVIPNTGKDACTVS